MLLFLVLFFIFVYSETCPLHMPQLLPKASDNPRHFLCRELQDYTNLLGLNILKRKKFLVCGQILNSPLGTEHMVATANKSVTSHILVTETCCSHAPNSGTTCSKLRKIILTHIQSTDTPWSMVRGTGCTAWRTATWAVPSKNVTCGYTRATAHMQTSR